MSRNKVEFIIPTKKDYGNFAKLQLMAHNHSSGGSFDMAAMWVKGSNCEIGLNRLKRSAKHINSSYPETHGVHAELDLFHNTLFQSGTVFVAGKHHRSGTPLINTGPCIYCNAILVAAKIRYVVFLYKNVLVKVQPKELL